MNETNTKTAEALVECAYRHQINAASHVACHGLEKPKSKRIPDWPNLVNVSLGVMVANVILEVVHQGE